MTLPAPNLDDLRFQKDLVDEARKRIIHYCPEWTDYNLSDPGITLIELFAWMTELMVYRLNRVPEKNYIKFLEMLGLKRMPASSASTELTFWLSRHLGYDPHNPQTVTVPEGTEVRAEQTDEEVLFATDGELEIVAPRLAHIRREGEFEKNYFPNVEFTAFSQPPRPGNAFYIGFDAVNDISGHIIQLAFTCEPNSGLGIKRNDPPLAWECLMPRGVWKELHLSQIEGEKDTTGGLNNEQGSLTLYLPLEFAPESLQSVRAFWLRCRIKPHNPKHGMYTQSPCIEKIEAATIGAATTARHAMTAREEELGISNGEPAQTFTLRHAPVLDLHEDETLEVEQSDGEDSIHVPWQVVNDFSKSSRFDHHFMLDHTSGAISFGPGVRQPDGKVVQYGRIPESGRRIRFSSYRYGGGGTGNLPERRLTTMTSSLAYVARVSNLIPAAGGRDQESMDELKLRAQREVLAQHRAVTAQDYEEFTINYGRSVARAKCLLPAESGANGSGRVTVLVVPASADFISNGKFTALQLDEALRKGVRGHLDQYRLLTTPLLVREPCYFGVKVKARVIPQGIAAHYEEVVLRISRELKRFLSPLPLDEKPPLILRDGRWEGWPFGRALYVPEIYSLIQQVPSVRLVEDVEVCYRQIVPIEENSAFADSHDIDHQPPVLIPVEKVLQLPPDGLICSLEHEIEIVSIESLAGSLVSP